MPSWENAYDFGTIPRYSMARFFTMYCQCWFLVSPFSIIFLCSHSLVFVFQVGSKLNPGKSCKDIQSNGGTVSKNYYIRLAGETVQVYCDQETAGGGWTLAYSYKFTDPEHFNHGTNAVTPRPSWPSPGDVPVSNTIPLRY